MKVAVFNSKPYDRKYLSEANTGHELVFLEPRLTAATAQLTAGFDAVSIATVQNPTHERLPAAY